MQSSELSNFGKVGNFNFLINKKIELPRYFPIEDVEHNVLSVV